jgi:hypothetical protein
MVVSDYMQTEIIEVKPSFRPVTGRPVASFWKRTVRSTLPRGKHPSMIRPSVAYLRAMREADLAVVNFARKYSVRQFSRSFSTSLN